MVRLLQREKVEFNWTTFMGMLLSSICLITRLQHRRKNKMIFLFLSQLVMVGYFLTFLNNFLSCNCCVSPYDQCTHFDDCKHLYYHHNQGNPVNKHSHLLYYTVSFCLHLFMFGVVRTSDVKFASLTHFMYIK